MDHDLKIPNFDHDDTAFVVKEVTVLSAFIAAVGKLWSIFRSERPKRMSLRERVELMHTSVTELKTDVGTIKSDVMELQESERIFTPGALTQILNELSSIRADQRQTRIALDNTVRTVTDILTMKQEERQARIEHKQEYRQGS